MHCSCHVRARTSGHRAAWIVFRSRSTAARDGRSSGISAQHFSARNRYLQRGPSGGGACEGTACRQQAAGLPRWHRPPNRSAMQRRLVPRPGPACPRARRRRCESPCAPHGRRAALAGPRARTRASVAHFEGQSFGNVGLSFLVTTARMTSLSLRCRNTFSAVNTSHIRTPAAPGHHRALGAGAKPPQQPHQQQRQHRKHHGCQLQRRRDAGHAAPGHVRGTHQRHRRRMRAGACLRGRASKSRHDRARVAMGMELTCLAWKERASTCSRALAACTHAQHVTRVRQSPPPHLWTAARGACA